MFPMPEPILAITPGQIIGLIIFTVSVLSWFVNIIQGNQQNQAPRPKNRPRDPVQNELEKFLQEVVGNKGQQEKKRPPGVWRSPLMHCRVRPAKFCCSTTSPMRMHCSLS